MIQSQRKTRRKSVPSTFAAPIESEDNTALARALSGIVAGRATARAKLAQIESLIAKPGKSSHPKRKKGNNPPTDDHSVRSLQRKIAREINQIGDASPNSVAASNSVGQNAETETDIDSVFYDTVDFERGLDSLLAKFGVKSKRVRGELARAFSCVATKAKGGQDVRAAITAINKLGSNEAAPLSYVPPLPKKAPIRYNDREDKSQNIVDFLLDPNGWGPWVRIGALPRQTLRQLDPPAYAALNYWLRIYSLPPGIEIPTRTQLIDRVVASGNIPVSEVPRLARTLLRRTERARSHPKS